jgi:hypothetical protein
MKPDEGREGDAYIDLHGHGVPATKLGEADDIKFPGPVYLVQSEHDQWALVTPASDGSTTTIYGLYASEQEARRAYQRALAGDDEEPISAC